MEENRRTFSGSREETRKAALNHILLSQTAEPHLGIPKLSFKLNCWTTIGHKLKGFPLGRKPLCCAQTKHVMLHFSNSRNTSSFWMTKIVSQKSFWMSYWETHHTRLAIGLIFFVSTFFSAVNLLTDCWATLILKQNT